MRGCVSLAHGLLSTLQVEQGLETYKYILHPALTKLVTPTTRLMMLSMNDFVIKVLYLSRGEQSHRCGIIGYNVLQAAFQISGAPLLSHFTCGLELLCVLCIAMTVSL